MTTNFEVGAKKARATGFILEYDAARKIAQGLGAHLEDLSSVVEISGAQARLLPVGQRTRHLFGKDDGKIAPAAKKKAPQTGPVRSPKGSCGGETAFSETKIERHGETVLDRNPPKHDSLRGGPQRSLESTSWLKMAQVTTPDSGRLPRHSLLSYLATLTKSVGWIGVLAERKA